MQKIKVAEVVPEMLPMPPVLGGAVELLTYDLCLQLSKKPNWDITIFSRPPQDSVSVNTSNKIFDSKLKYSYIPFTKSDKFFMNIKTKVSWHNPLRFIAKLQNVHFYSSKVSKKIDNNFDIIHIHNDPNVVFYIKKNSPNAKIILHMHNNHLADGGLLGRRYAKAINLCDKIIFVSKFLMDEAVKKHPFVRNKFDVVYNGINTIKFKQSSKKKITLIRKNLGITTEPMILFVGRLIPEKGVHLLLSSFVDIKKKYPNAKLVIVGASWFGKDTKSKYISDLIKLSSDFEKDIIFTGYINHDKMPDIFSAADLFVCPSTWDEPFGLVCAEAMACQTPVVVSNSGGLVEMLPKDYKYICKSNDSKDLSNKIIDLLNNKKRKILGKQLRMQIIKNFSTQVFSKSIERIINNQLGGNRI